VFSLVVPWVASLRSSPTVIHIQSLRDYDSATNHNYTLSYLPAKPAIDTLPVSLKLPRDK